MSMFLDGLTWHATQLLAAAGQNVTYRRGATELPITAVEGRTAYEAATTEETRIRGQRTDWICDRAAIAGLFPPAAGDQIQQGTNVFEVQNLGDEPCYRELHSSALIRIHVRLL